MGSRRGRGLDKLSINPRSTKGFANSALGGCPGDEFTIDSEMSGSKARHGTLKACATSLRRSCLGQLTRAEFQKFTYESSVKISPLEAG